MVQEYLEFARRLAEQAGELLMAHYDAIDGADIDYKSVRELVTKADVLSEKTIAGEIRRTYPGHQILAEEGSGRGVGDSDSEFCWIVDPLDGTTNFVHSHPFFSVSIALRWKGELVVGVVHAPYLEETFCAAKGQGATLNDDAISISGADSLMKSIVATGFSYHRDQEKYDNSRNFVKILHLVRGVRRCGSAALDLAYVAAGRYDGFWEIGLQPHDNAAGTVLVREAGGEVTDFAGGGDHLFGENIVATNGLIHEMILNQLDPFA